MSFLRHEHTKYRIPIVGFYFLYANQNKWTKQEWVYYCTVKVQQPFNKVAYFRCMRNKKNSNWSEKKVIFLVIYLSPKAGQHKNTPEPTDVT